MLIYLLEVCQDWGGQEGGFLVDILGSWSEIWKTGSSFMSWRMFFSCVQQRKNATQEMRSGLFILKKIPWKFHVDIFIRSVLGMGGQEGGYLAYVEGFWSETWRTGYPWCHGWCFSTLRKTPWKFSVDIFIRSLLGIGGQEEWYLEDVEGSWLETWRFGSPLTSWMIFSYPK